MAWDNLSNVVGTAANQFRILGNLTSKYKAGKRIKVRGTQKSNGVYRIISSGWAAGKTQITVAADLTEDSSNIGQIAIFKSLPAQHQRKSKSFREFMKGG